MTVGPGITPDLLTLAMDCEALAGFTAGGEFHPALRTMPLNRRATMDI
jgi:hypothetical protein